MLTNQYLYVLCGSLEDSTVTGLKGRFKEVLEYVVEKVERINLVDSLTQTQ